MKFDENIPPRCFQVGRDLAVTMKDCGTVFLAADEQMTLKTEAGAEYDVARKSWGFYATPSLNGRLAAFGLRGVLVRNRATGHYFILLVEKHQQTAFEAYLVQEQCEIVVWLDTDQALERLKSACNEKTDDGK